MNDKIEILKELAMTKVYSHGAFGERESRLKLDPDNFAEYIIKDCVSICENAIGYKTLTPAKAKAALIPG